ncbi:hypothetical protein J8J27_25320, partial [Mycobacterium tuberculosis]|nr:hypothetical protein [Mycobacterium tuberculosis]
MPRKIRDDLTPIVAEIDVLGTLLRQVTETVADLEIRVQQPAPPAPVAEAPPPAEAPAVARERPTPARPAAPLAPT